VTTVDMSILREDDLDLHRVLVVELGTPETGFQDVDLARLSASRGALLEWLGEYERAHPPVPLRRIPLPVTPPAITPLPASGDRDIDTDLKTDLQEAADRFRGTQRLNEWAEVGGLEDTQQNANLIREFIEKSDVHGYLSSEIVDVAVANLGPRGTKQLTFRVVKAAPPQPEQRAEVLDPLPNGEARLSLDATPSNRHSKEQIRDWLARTREVTRRYLRPSGSFGSKFI
jgi:hypothetical protein